MITPPRSPKWRVLALAAFASAVSACATAAGTPASPTTPSGTPNPGTTTQPAQVRWPVKTAAHFDLWLHSFAQLTVDTTVIPLFKRGYRDSIAAVKSRSNVLTSLDANRDNLQKRLTANPALVQAQFLVFEFGSFAELQQATSSFIQAQGDKTRAADQAAAATIARLTPLFPTVADRDWLRLFMAGVTEEQSRFYDVEYKRVSAARSGVFSAVDALWQKTYRPKFDRFLNNTGQRNGEIYLSLPLGGEGRTATGANNQTLVAVPFPARASDAQQAIFVFAHEVTGNLVGPIVNDNTTPAQQRAGQTASLVAVAQVYAGLILLQKIAPELAEPYARYYLAQGGKMVPSSNAQEALRSAFPLPAAITTGIARQIEIVLGGI
ncbi:MAG: hypothetical protein ABJB74_13015 [Gemmatimonas sp.]